MFHTSISFLFFYCYADLRDLHSFPTRRSSDLRSWSERAAEDIARSRRLVEEAIEKLSGRTDEPFASTRSEEHTSELQSPCNLVCRLLLEKKKKKIKASEEPYKHK